LILLCPPRHGKSLLAAQMFPAWYLGRHPDRFAISASYGQELADDFGRKVRNLVSDPLHRAIFPGCRLSDDSSSMRRFNTTAGGSYYAVGRGGPITGRGAHLLIIDDPIKDREEAQSEAIRHGLHEWYSSVAYTRLQPGAAIVLIQTRWHQDDLAGWLLREHVEEGWEVVSFPAIAERDEGFRREGEPLWPKSATVAPRPVRWEMDRVLTITSVLGTLALIESFGLLYLADSVMHLERPLIQTVLFLRLVVGGHLLLFVSRSKGPCWRPPYPARILLWAILGTQAFAALMTAFGWLVPAIS